MAAAGGERLDLPQGRNRPEIYCCLRELQIGASGPIRPGRPPETEDEMSGHPNFDHAVQEGNLWLKRVTAELHLSDPRHAYSALRATLHALRDRLAPESAVHLSAQLPMLIRGLYFEGWHMSGKPTAHDQVAEFCADIDRELPPAFPMDAKTVAQGVFRALWMELDPGTSAKIVGQLPHPLRALWPQHAGRT
jgi:uncharacterized protein (DUF2267 family)